MRKYKFKYRLSTKSNLATIAKAVRALGYDMTIEKGGFKFGWWKEVPEALLGKLYYERFVLDENVPEWLNGELERTNEIRRNYGYYGCKICRLPHCRIG
ncbi:MAG: hypothetical protein IJ057_06525 [Bacteroidales bacterium]|nr:hypothetical protein [Bacteroidales bacterium]